MKTQIRLGRLAAAALAVVAIIGPAPVVGHPPAAPAVYRSDQFIPVAPSPRETARVASQPPEPTDRPTPAPTAKPRPSTARHVTGIATWYCNFHPTPTAPASACHYAYPDGPGIDRYAAAGPALRRAMGPDWRGQFVTVTANGHSVTVQLIDWCACAGDHVIDLYRDAFVLLDPDGQPSTIRW